MIDRNIPPTENEISTFLSTVNFSLPVGFIDFFKEANGADITTDDHYVALWPLTDMAGLNKKYNVNEYAPEFFIIGSDGGDMSYTIEKNTGYVFELPFIGMSREEAVFKCKTFTEFIGSL